MAVSDHEFGADLLIKLKYNFVVSRVHLSNPRINYLEALCGNSTCVVRTQHHNCH